jgi:hypothetical protein
MRRAIETHLASRQVPRVVYGAIIGLALVVALEAHPPSAGVMVGTIALTAVAVGLAEVYSEIVGAETRLRRGVDRERVRSAFGEAMAVAFGISFPAVFFALAAAGAFELDTAFTVAKWSGLALTGFYGFAGARLAGDSLPASLLHGAVIAFVGTGLILLKSLLH